MIPGRLWPNLPSDHGCRANLALIVSDVDRLEDWIVAMIHRVGGDDFSGTGVRGVDFSDEFSPVVANLHLALLD